MHSPSTASGVATALRASKSRQNHSSVCSGSPLRSRPVKGQPPAPNARLGAAPPCELQPRRWPTQLTLREACPGSGMKGGCFSVRPQSHVRFALGLLLANQDTELTQNAFGVQVERRVPTLISLSSRSFNGRTSRRIDQSTSARTHTIVGAPSPPLTPPYDRR